MYLTFFIVSYPKLAFINSTSILSGLLNKKLPTKLLDQLNAHGIRLFPQDWKAIKAKCNCPDWVMPCKYIAAVIYLISILTDDMGLGKTLQVIAAILYCKNAGFFNKRSSINYSSY